MDAETLEHPTEKKEDKMKVRVGEGEEKAKTKRCSSPLRMDGWRLDNTQKETVGFHLRN